MTRPLHIALVSHYFPPHVGGIEVVVQHEAQHVAERGHHVTVLTSAVGGTGATDAGADFVLVQVPVWDQINDRTGVPFPIPRLRAIRMFWHHLSDADVIHVHDVLYPTTWLAFVIAVLTDRPLVLTQHVALIAHPRRVVKWAQRAVYSTIGRLIVRRADVVFYLNGSVATFLIGLGALPDRLELLPNGVDTDVFHPGTPAGRSATRLLHGLSDDAVIATFVGRFVPKKGFATLLDARPTEVVLALVGGERPAAVEPEENVHYLGALLRSEVAEVYRASDLFVLPSEAEGFPLTVQEAMASGLPVVTTNDPGYDVYGFDRELVALVEPRAEVIRPVLELLAKDPERRAAMAAYSLQVVRERFTWTAHVDVLVARYRAAAGRARDTR